MLYVLRHTFLTRLGETGCDAWTLARIAEHTSIAMSARYVHPSHNAVLNVFARFQTAEGKKGDCAERAVKPESSYPLRFPLHALEKCLEEK